MTEGAHGGVGDWLVILDKGTDVGLIEERASPLARAGRRVLLVPAGEVAALRGLPGVRALTDRPPDPALLADLDPGERLFVEGWVSRTASEGKARPGVGLDWDAEGYEPP